MLSRSLLSCGSCGGVFLGVGCVFLGGCCRLCLVVVFFLDGYRLCLMVVFFWVVVVGFVYGGRWWLVNLSDDWLILGGGGGGI